MLTREAVRGLLKGGTQHEIHRATDKFFRFTRHFQQVSR